jgi:hypothetical protein
MFLLVRTDTSVKHAGITFLLMDMESPGVSVKPILLISGNSPFCETFIENVRVPVRNVVGQVNGGWAIAKMLLRFERNMIADVFKEREDRSRLITMAQRYLAGEDGRVDDAVVRDRVTQIEIDQRGAPAVECPHRPDPHAGRPGVDDEQRHGLGALRRHHELGRGMAVEHEPLVPGQPEARRRALGTGRDAPGIVAAVGLGPRQRQRRAPRHHRRQPRALLRGVAGREDRHARDERRDDRLGDQRLTELLEDERQIDEARADAAHGLGEHQAEPAEIAHLAPHLGRPPDRILAQLAHPRHRRLLAGERERRVDEHALIFCECEVHPSPRMCLAMMLRWISFEPP